MWFLLLLALVNHDSTTVAPYHTSYPNSCLPFEFFSVAKLFKAMIAHPSSISVRISTIMTRKTDFSHQIVLPIKPFIDATLTQIWLYVKDGCLAKLPKFLLCHQEAPIKSLRGCSLCSYSSRQNFLSKPLHILDTGQPHSWFLEVFCRLLLSLSLLTITHYQVSCLKPLQFLCMMSLTPVLIVFFLFVHPVFY